MFCCDQWQFVLVIPNLVRFALSLTISEISANLRFLKKNKNFEIFEMFKNVPDFNLFFLSHKTLSLTVSEINAILEKK